MERREPYLKIWQDLARDKSMVFLTGPRQAGKTTLAQIISRSFSNNLYFNWDIAHHRTRLINNPSFFEAVERKDSSTPLIVFDEIHKYKDWKNYLKLQVSILLQHHYYTKEAQARFHYLRDNAGCVEILLKNLRNL